MPIGREALLIGGLEQQAQKEGSREKNKYLEEVVDNIVWRRRECHIDICELHSASHQQECGAELTA